MATKGERLKKILREAKELLMPRFCPLCGCQLHENETVCCASCLVTLPRTGYMGRPGNPVERLFYPDMPIGRAHAWLFYTPKSLSARIILQLKYEHDPELGVAIGRHMANELRDTDFFNGIDAIVPAPLARGRMGTRGYNQSERVARGIAQMTGLEVWDDVIERKHSNETQTRLWYRRRISNVEGQFECRLPERLRGRHVLLVDDVVTTGSTLRACMKAMLACEGIKFSVLAISLGHSRPYRGNVTDYDFDEG